MLFGEPVWRMKLSPESSTLGTGYDMSIQRGNDEFRKKQVGNI
jgi:hypothetical protein